MYPVEVESSTEEQLLSSAASRAATGEASNSSISAQSDFNGDGKDDLAIGVPREDIGTIANAGAVNVIYGSSSGLQTSSPADQFWHQNKPGVEDTAEAGGFGFGDMFGAALAAGDFNNDGFGDLAIGVPEEDIAGATGLGAVHILHGSSSGLQTTSPADQFWKTNSPGLNGNADTAFPFGSSLAAGDFNGDGNDDLAVGAYKQGIGNEGDAGAVHVLYGSTSGLQTASPAPQFWHQNSPGVENSVKRSEFFGFSLAAGDFNNDGKDDLAIGAPDEGWLSPNRNVGAVNVLYGSSSGLQTSSPADQFWDQNSPGVEGIPAEEDHFGWSLAAGDFDNDGNDDLAIGVPGDHAGNSGAGAVNILYGSSSAGLRTTSPADQFWHQNSPGLEDVAELSEHFGGALAASDFNGDGFADLAVGVDFETVGTITNAGAVNVLYGSSSGLQTSSPADQFWHQNSPGVEDTAENGDRFGFSLASGDFNGDGKDDLAIGVRFEGIGNVGSAGAVNVLYGSSSGLRTSSPADQFWNQNSPGVEDTAEGGDLFGSSVT